MTVADLTVLAVASEVYPLVKTGGLADVTGALPLALTNENVAVHTVVPGYPAVMQALEQSKGKHERVHSETDLFGGLVSVIAATLHGLSLLVLDAPHLYARPGNPYLGPDGLDWPDNHLRFAALSWMAAEIGKGAITRIQPDVVHAHDWQTGLALAYPKVGNTRHPPGVMTVHNLAYQGRVPADQLLALRLPTAAFATEGLEFHGDISFLKAGLHYADRITTVSPTYAVEILGGDAGMGFDGLLRARADVLTGILNGIDTNVWNPATDPALTTSYDAKRMAGRARNKAALQKHFGLAVDPKALVFGVVSRLSWQKGLDLLLECLPTVIAAKAQLVLLGAGDKDLEQAFEQAAADYPGQIGCKIGYDEALAHRIQAGCDALLVPSRFEPCGLTQLCALRYGGVPVVARVGGLSDTVIDLNEMAKAADVATGIQFAPVTSDGLQAAIRRTCKTWMDQPRWKAMQKRGMATDVSWAQPAKHYAALYRELVANSCAKTVVL
jgi:starch synthase